VFTGHLLSIHYQSQFQFDWDYVSAGYGTGAVMAVPCGDERDHAFATLFKGQDECLKSRIFCRY
jgi:leucyl-tRNA synthetase